MMIDESSQIEARNQGVNISLYQELGECSFKLKLKFGAVAMRIKRVKQCELSIFAKEKRTNLMRRVVVVYGQSK